MADNFVLSAVLELKDKFTGAIEGARRSAIGFERTFRNTASVVQSSASRINSGLDKMGTVVNKISGTVVKIRSYWSCWNRWAWCLCYKRSC